jgi:hypothetical protein
VQQDSGGTHSQTHYLHHPRPRSGIPSPTRFLAPLPSMLHANDAAPTPLGLSLELVVEQASVVEQEYRPAPCLATTKPIYTETYIPGAGEYKLSVKPYQPYRRHSTDNSCNRTPKIYERFVAVESLPKNASSADHPCLSPSVPNSLTGRRDNSCGTPTSLRQAHPPLPSVQTPPGSPAPSTIADSVGDPTESGSRSGQKRKRIESEEGTDDEVEGDGGYAYKKRRVLHGRESLPV